MKLNTFQSWAVSLFGSYGSNAPDITDDRHLAISALGLNGEAGEASEHVKKYIRGDGASLYRNEDFGRELGDTLFYLSVLAAQGGYTLDEIAELLEEKLADRRASKGKPTAPLIDEPVVGLTPALNFIDEQVEECNVDLGSEYADVTVGFGDARELANRYAKLVTAAAIVARQVRA